MRRSTIPALVVALSTPMVILADDISANNSNCSGRVRSTTIYIDTHGDVFDSAGHGNYYPCVGMSGAVTFAPSGNGRFKAIFGWDNPFNPQHDVLFTNHSPTGNITSGANREFKYIACGAAAGGNFICKDPKIIVNQNELLGEVDLGLQPGEHILITSEAELSVDPSTIAPFKATSSSCEDGKHCVTISFTQESTAKSAAKFTVTYQLDGQVIQQTIAVMALPAKKP
jgi:hypothetical protein